MPTIRAFIAIELPRPVKATLAEVSAQLESGLPRGAVRWGKPEAMHLTLRFLGDTDLKALPAVTAALDSVAAARPAFAMHLDGLGCFPNPHRPRVIWVGLDGGQESLLALKDTLDAALVPLGWPAEDKPFRAHLTLGRVKEEGRLRDFAPEAAVPSMLLPVTALHLIESDLRPEGPRYTIRHTAPLAAG